MLKESSGGGGHPEEADPSDVRHGDEQQQDAAFIEYERHQTYPEYERDCGKARERDGVDSEHSGG
jgi:hypothetical protein